MYLKQILLLFLLILTFETCQTHRHDGDSKSHGQPLGDTSIRLPYSQKKFNKMLQRAIFKIITGELSEADQNLLKSLNFNLTEILALREYELKKREEEEKTNLEAMQKINHLREEKDITERNNEYIEAFNRKALEDYESLVPIRQSSEETKLDDNSDESMKPQVIFQIRPDDSEFDVISEESTEMPSNSGSTDSSLYVEPFLDSGDGHLTTDSIQLTSVETKEEDFVVSYNSTDDNVPIGVNNFTSEETTKKVYKGLEFVQDDVYRVIPDEIFSSYDYENTESENVDYEDTKVPLNETTESLYPNWSMHNDEAAANTSYKRVMMAERRSKGQRVIEDIKMKVLMMTGRFNQTISQVPKEKLTMYLPTCQVPKNADAEAWSDPLLMNMYFQLNLTATEYISAARLRIFNLPILNITTTTPNVLDNEEDETKIRLSVYVYTRPLKKHRTVKKRLIDSVVASLSSTGNHIALDVRQALQFWRRNTQQFSQTSSSNHGIVIQVEDQEGRSLQPASYIQQSSCQEQDQHTNEKAYFFVPALFVRACSRYIRTVNGELQSYYHCKKS